MEWLGRGAVPYVQHSQCEAEALERNYKQECFPPVCGGKRS